MESPSLNFVRWQQGKIIKWAKIKRGRIFSCIQYSYKECFTFVNLQTSQGHRLNGIIIIEYASFYSLTDWLYSIFLSKRFFLKNSIFKIALKISYAKLSASWKKVKTHAIQMTLSQFYHKTTLLVTPCNADFVSIYEKAV